ncbi:MAG: baseplate J/gp47 family protein [Oscillospiraceae bacterium]
MFENVTPENIKASILSKLTSFNTGTGSFANTIVAGAAFEIWQTLVAMNALVPMFYIDESSGEFIDKKCGEYGISRKPGAKAVVQLSFTGTLGTTIPARSAFLTAEGLVFLTDSALTLSGGAGTVFATAEAASATYNVSAGKIVSSKLAIGGLSSVNNPAPATGGVDGETDIALVERFYAYLRCPPTSGNAYNYRSWALEIVGVGAAKVLSLWAGAGTVKVLLAGSDGRAVSSQIIRDTALHIEEERPIGAIVTVEGASELLINVAATVSIDGSTTKAAVKAAFSKAIKEYLSSLVFSTYTVNFNRLSYLLLSVPGVLDYSALTLNGGTANITIGESQIPVSGSLEVV